MQQPHRSATSRIGMFVDFDGTISIEDTTDIILERFAEPAWRAIEDEWLAGKIGSRECLARQIDLVRASPEALDGLVRELHFDPNFSAFVELCRAHTVPVTVVSDGLDRAVNAILKRAGVETPFIANRLEWLGDDRWRLQFPHAQDNCRSAAGNCKCTTLNAMPDTVRVLIGDGRSDICAAENADIVLAKSALAEHCSKVGIPYLSFTDFAGAISLLADWIGAHARRDIIPRKPKSPIHASSSA